MFRPRELMLLRALHTSGSLTSAAALVHLSQPAASAMVRQVEDRIGFQLFTREKRRLAWTANGRTLLPELLSAAASLDSANRLAHDLRTGWTHRLILGAVPVLGLSLFPESITAMQRRDPAASILIRTGTTSAVAAMAADQRVDLGVVIGTVADDRLALRCLGALSLCCVLHPAHPLAGRRLTLRQVGAERYIALSRELPVGNATARELEALGLRYAPAIEVTQTAAACTLVACQAGIAIVESTGADHARRSGLLVRRLKAIPTLTLNLVWARSRGLSALGAEFVDDLAQRVDRLLATRPSKRPSAAAAGSRLG